MVQETTLMTFLKKLKRKHKNIKTCKIKKYWFWLWFKKGLFKKKNLLFILMQI